MPPKNPAHQQGDGQQEDHRADEEKNKHIGGGGVAAPSEHIEVILERLSREPAWLRTPDAQREISEFARHLATCEHCQLLLDALLSDLNERADPRSERAATSQRLLERLRAVVERSRARKQLSAYALKWCALGERAARETFPETGAHLATCAVCREEVMRRLESLREQMSALLAPRLDVARPAGAVAGPPGAAALSAGVERLAQAPIRLSGVRQVAASTLIVSVGAEAGEISAILGHEVLAMSVEDRQRVALVCLELGEPTFSWRSLRRAQRERQLAEQGPWLAEVPLGGDRAPRHAAFGSAPWLHNRGIQRRPTVLGLDARIRRKLESKLGEVWGALLRAAEEEPPRVLLVTSLAEVESVRRTEEIIATLRQVARRQGLPARVTVLCVPASTPARLKPGQPPFDATGDATGAAPFDAAWLVGLDDAPPEAHAQVLSHQLRAWLGGGAEAGGAEAGGAEAGAMAGNLPRQPALPAYASMAAEVVFPLEETALAFALRSAATMLPTLAEYEGLSHSSAWAPQEQLTALAMRCLAEWRERIAQVPGTRYLFDHPHQQGTPGVDAALERLYAWATLGTTPRATDVRGAGNQGEEAIISTHLEGCFEALAVARRDAAQTSAGEDARAETDEEKTRWLALTLVGYFRWYYGEKLGTLDLCELLLRAGHAVSLDACAALLARQAAELQVWLESTTPRVPTEHGESTASANRLTLSLRGQPDVAWRAMADSLRATLGRKLGPTVAVALDTTSTDPHRLRLWFTRPTADLAERGDPLAWLAVVGGADEREVRAWRQATADLPNSGGLVESAPEGQPAQDPRGRGERAAPQPDDDERADEPRDPHLAPRR